MSGALVLEHLTAGYGATTVLDDVSLTLADAGTCAVLGRNGVGKTTLLATIMGHTTRHGGSIRLGARDLTALPVHRRVREGLGFVPQEREIFPSLTVAENLSVAQRPGAWTLERVYDLFPRLAERRHNGGTQLSGGEQQMLAIGRALMGNPRLLLMDEPLEGLAPVIVETLLAAMRRLRAESALAILLVEQHASRALDFAESTIVLDRGKITYDGPSATLRAAPERLAALIGVSGSRK
ncbi:MAG: ABC transporter ATP-binding protein [Alphaproteobacteria bacterium]|nr:ABC transporter ATP-binding protein [Alphaproteobacteria bacterium]